MKMSKGFTLIELMVVLAIITLLSAIVAGNLGGMTERTRVSSANADIKMFEDIFSIFVVDNEEFPNRNSTTKNYYTLLFSGQSDNDGTALTAVVMKDKQGIDNSHSGVLDVADFPVIKRDNLYNHWVVNNRSYPGIKEHGPKGAAYGWNGSYLKLQSTTMLDPWGNSYIITFKDQGEQGNGTVRIFILSAGPDKIMDTDPATAAVIDPDDIGVTWLARP